MKQDIKISKRILTGFIVAILLNSCSPEYIPNVINAPLLSQKGEIQAAIHTGTAGTDPQFAYALTDNIGIMLNSSFASRTDSGASYHTHNFIELGAGYFNKFGGIGTYEIFGGYGAGNLEADYANSLWSSYANVTSNRIFIQPSAGISSDIVDFGLSTRFVIVSMTQNSAKSTGLFLEPAITAKLGYKYVKLMYQFGLSFPLNEKTMDFSNQPLLMSIGIQVFINKGLSGKNEL